MDEIIGGLSIIVVVELGTFFKLLIWTSYFQTITIDTFIPRYRIWNIVHYGCKKYTTDMIYILTTGGRWPEFYCLDALGNERRD